MNSPFIAVFHLQSYSKVSNKKQQAQFLQLGQEDPIFPLFVISEIEIIGTMLILMGPISHSAFHIALINLK